MPSAEALKLNVTSDANIGTADRDVLAWHGRNDELLNNAGVRCC
jgi:hypothetical protein